MHPRGYKGFALGTFAWCCFHANVQKSAWEIAHIIYWKLYSGTGTLFTITLTPRKSHGKSRADSKLKLSHVEKHPSQLPTPPPVPLHPGALSLVRRLEIPSQSLLTDILFPPRAAVQVQRSAIPPTLTEPAAPCEHKRHPSFWRPVSFPLS